MSVGEKSMELRETDRCRRVCLTWRMRGEEWGGGRLERGRSRPCDSFRSIKELGLSPEGHGSP